jgi:large repetitive protein
MKHFIAMLVLSLMVGSALAQGGEICNNGVDDDGDGFIDCYDRACAVSTFCKDFFLGEVADCYAEPPAFPEFTMTRDFTTRNKTANHLGRIVVGDVDGDGTPEMVTTNKFTKRIFIMSGADGTVEDSVTVSFSPGWEDVLIANIDPINGPCAEIVVVDAASWSIYMYDCNLTQKWGPVKLLGDPGMMGFADFNGDGNVELYSRDAIFDAATGNVIVPTKATSKGMWEGQINGGPVAVDMLDHPSNPAQK